MFVLVHQGIISNHMTNDCWPFSLGERYLGLQGVYSRIQILYQGLEHLQQDPPDNLKTLFHCAYAGFGS